MAEWNICILRLLLLLMQLQLQLLLVVLLALFPMLTMPWGPGAMPNGAGNRLLEQCIEPLLLSLLLL